MKGKTGTTIRHTADITELRPQLSGKEILIGAFIGNYDKGGHQISLELSIHPDQQKIVNNNFVLPVFNTTNVMEMAGQDYPTMFNSDKGVEVEFTLTKDLKDLKMLSYVILQLVTVAGEQVMNLFQKRTLFIWMANSHMLLHHGEQIVDPTDYSILHQVILKMVFHLQILVVPTGVPEL